jgi:hypothetical protein
MTLHDHERTMGFMCRLYVAISGKQYFYIWIFRPVRSYIPDQYYIKPSVADYTIFQKK